MIQGFTVPEIIRAYRVCTKAGDLIRNDKFVGNHAFVIERDHAGILNEIIDSLDCDFDALYERVEISAERCLQVQPSSIEKDFVPTRKIRLDFRPEPSLVADHDRPFDIQYYWLLVEKMGFTIHGDKADKPHSLVNDGKIVGSCMMIDNSILKDTKNIEELPL